MVVETFDDWCAAKKKKKKELIDMRHPSHRVIGQGRIIRFPLSLVNATVNCSDLARLQ